jgi:hypothetical protein
VERVGAHRDRADDLGYAPVRVGRDGDNRAPEPVAVAVRPMQGMGLRDVQRVDRGIDQGGDTTLVTGAERTQGDHRKTLSHQGFAAGQQRRPPRPQSRSRRSAAAVTGRRRAR